MRKKYEDLKKRVLSFCSKNEAELKRVEEEIALFEERGWNDYILFLFIIHEKLYDPPSFMNKSAMGSYFLFRSCHFYNQGKLEDENARDILFNDALRFGIELEHDTEQKLLEEFRKVNNVIEDALSSIKLKYYEVITANEYEHKSELVIISRTEIPPEDIKVILEELKESSDENKVVLRKYLLLDISLRLRI